MRYRPFTVAASACCLLLLAAGNPTASEVLSGGGGQVSAPESLKAIRVANDEAPANKNRGETTPSNNPPAIILDERNVQGILGNAVRSAANEDMGLIVDVIVDRSGTVRAVVIDFGGFLGIGSRKIVVDWNAMRFTSLDRVTIDMTREQVKAAPEYETRKPITMLGAALEFARSRVTERMPEH